MWSTELFFWGGYLSYFWLSICLQYIFCRHFLKVFNQKLPEQLTEKMNLLFWDAFFPLPEMTKKLAKNVPKVSFLKVTLLCLRSLDRSLLSHIQLFMFFSSILFIWCPKNLGRCCWVTAELIRQAAILVRAWCLWLSFLAALRQDCSICAV